jgi:hypothetical protein
MKTIEVTTKSRGTLTVNVPSTVDDWQLYHGVKGASQAASALTAALVRAMKTLVKDGSADAESACWKLVYPVCNKHADTGAADTEPGYVAQGALRRFQKQLRGGSYDSF